MCPDLQTPVGLDVRLAGLLDVAGPEMPRGPRRRAPKLISARREAIATAVAAVVGVHSPGTPEAVEALSEVVLLIQGTGVLSDGEGPVLWTGGLSETGRPIDPEERLVDCVIAAADLGMFDPVPPPDPATLRSSSFEPGEFSFGLSRPQLSLFQRAAWSSSINSMSDEPLSINAQFVINWDCFMWEIVDALIDEMAGFGLIDIGHSG